MRAQRFTGVLSGRGPGGGFVAVPFDPDAVWGAKPRHPVTGTVNGYGFRGVIATDAEGVRGFPVGAAWLRDRAVGVGDEVDVELTPEGPQRTDLDADVAAALVACPRAGAFFDGLAQFYRKAYLRWIDGTRRRPEERARRIADMVSLLENGHKQRPH
ncbi:YdeI/OmpD-associated family protein [Longispora urticae]